jgi:hypothetical protein
LGRRPDCNSDWYVVNYTVDKDGNVNVGTEDSWTPVDRAWVEEKVGLSGPDFIAEMFLAGDTATQQTVGEDGLIYKPVMREGVWMFSPGPGQKAIPKPIRVVKDGPSDPANLVVSLDELKKNFDAGAIEHVTIPTSHADKVTENTGFIRKLRFSKDEQGRTVLEAGHDFTEPEIKDKALRGTIANTSAGILFDYIHKEKGKKYGAVLAHVALTNRPWLNGMKPFGVEAAENLEVIGFSDVEQPIEQPSQDGGGESMSELTVDLATLGLSSADELKQILAERETLRAKDRERDVADRCAKWQKDGVSPALVTEAKTIMMSDKGDTVLNLSEEGKEVGLTATDIVERLIAKAPAVNLADDPVVDAAASDDKPDDKDPKTVELSQEEKKIARELWLYEEYSEADAVAEAKRRVASGGKN